MGSRPLFFVPSVLPIELFFFQRVFQHLCWKQERRLRRVDVTKGPGPDGAESVDIMDTVGIPLVEFQRAMMRLFRVIRDDRSFDIGDYDYDRNGRVGWYEFCSLWRERGVYVQLSLAERVFLTLEDADRSLLGKLWSILIFGAIFVSTGSFILSTIPEYQTKCPVLGAAGYDPDCRPQGKAFFDVIDLVCIILFTAEYAIRLCLSAFVRTEVFDFEKTKLLAWMISDAPTLHPTRATRVFQWVTHWANLIDLAAILPWYLSELFGSSGGGGGQSVILKIIRLSRVIRAFRLGRRFEAVVIIMRSVRRSIRALYVLVLNLCLGMIIFGALMYFAEQGSWDPVTKTYLRWEDATTQGKSPFDSIPACFWWAIVTATTVGYGDDHTPTTLPGRLVAAVSMVWSLCVLALPIGVIGGNFSQVWEEYDKMKQQEKENIRKEEIMLKKSVSWGDPLYQCRQLILEVWHDTGLSVNPSDTSQNEFMGEVRCTLDFSPGQQVKKRRLRLPLAQNLEKARRKVRGSLTFEYSWQPSTGKSDPDVLLQGCLEVTVLSAENIVQVDWNGHSMTDAYCTIIAYPNSPDKDGNTTEVVKRTATIYDSIRPAWDSTVCFDMSWTQTASRRGMMADMRRTADFNRTAEFSRVSSTSSMDERRAPTEGRVLPQETGKSAPAFPKSEDVFSEGTSDYDKGDGSRTSQRYLLEDEAGTVLKQLPSLQEEVSELRAALPQLQAEVAGVRRDLQLALAALEQKAMPPCGGAVQPVAGEGFDGTGASDLLSSAVVQGKS